MFMAYEWVEFIRQHLCPDKKKSSLDGVLCNAYCAPLCYMEIHTIQGYEVILRIDASVVWGKGEMSGGRIAT